MLYKIGKILTLAMLLLIVVGIAYFVVTDVPIPQRDTVETIQIKDLTE